MWNNLVIQILIVCIIFIVIHAICITSTNQTNEQNIIRNKTLDKPVVIPHKRIARQNTLYSDRPISLTQPTPSIYTNPPVAEPEQIARKTVTFDDDFLYSDDSDINDYTVHRMHESKPGNPVMDDNHQTIAQMHDNYHMSQVNREEEDGNVDGHFDNDLYLIDDKVDQINGHTDFDTY